MTGNITGCPTRSSAPLLLTIASTLLLLSHRPSHLTAKWLHFHDYPKKLSDNFGLRLSLSSNNYPSAALFNNPTISHRGRARSPQQIFIGVKLFTKSSRAFISVKKGSSLSSGKALGPSHLALSGSGCASKNKPANPTDIPARPNSAT